MYRLPVDHISQHALCRGAGPGGFWSRGEGVLAPGCVWSQGGVCSRGGGVGIPACSESDPPPVNRMTDRCKNITFPQTSFAGGKDTNNYLEERGVVLWNKNNMQGRCPIFATFDLDNTILHDRPTLKFPSPNDSLRLFLLSVAICLKSVNVFPCAINLQLMTHKPVSGEIFSSNRLIFRQDLCQQETYGHQ